MVSLVLFIIIGVTSWAQAQTLQNVALGKVATQSSTYGSYEATLAIDGDTSRTSQPALTNKGSVTWWQVDLGGIYSVKELRVWNHRVYNKRLSDFYVFTSTDPFVSSKLATVRSQPGVKSFHFPGEAETPSIIPVDASARYIRVQVDRSDYLQILEVEAMGLLGDPPLSVTLSARITAPTTNADGTPLTDLDSYRIYTCGSPILAEKPPRCDGKLQIDTAPLQVNPIVVQYEVNKPMGVVYVVATALDKSGNESDLSAQHSLSYTLKKADGLPPSYPGFWWQVDSGSVALCTTIWVLSSGSQTATCQ